MSHCIPEFLSYQPSLMGEKYCIKCWLSEKEHPVDPRVAMVVYDEEFAVEQLERLMRARPSYFPVFPVDTPVTYLGNTPTALTGRQGVVVGTNTQLGTGSMRQMLSVKFHGDLGIHHLPANLFIVDSCTST